MISKRRLWRLAAAVVACATLAANASAQITTGTVSGTVKDAQGGVIPGATVVLVSETKGTKSAPVVTSDTGDYTFPNITPDTYTVEVTMEGFKTLRRQGVQVSGGDRVALGNQTIEVGGASETVNVTAEAALVQSQSGERSFAVTTTQVENLPVTHSNFTSLTSLVPGVVSGGASAGGTRLGGAGQNNIMMDGVSAMDTGNNGQMLSMNIESIGEVKILTQGYQAEYGRSSGLQITAVTKSRHEPVPRLGLRSADRLRLERELLGQRQERRRQGQSEHPDARLHDRRSGGQARRQQQAVLLLRARVPSADDGHQRR